MKTTNGVIVAFAALTITVWIGFVGLLAWLIIEGISWLSRN